MTGNSDRNLLFGILALQMDFISREGLITAMQAWTIQKASPLGELLVKQGAMSADDRAALEAMVDRHIAKHGGDPGQSLAALSSVSEVADELRQVEDAALHQSLAHVPTASPLQAGIMSGVIPGDPLPAASDQTAEPAELQCTLTQTYDPGARPKTRFLKLREHAQGGLGKIWVARDQELNRDVAFKEILPKRANDKNSRSRFLLEAEITGGLEHPGIVPVYGLGHFDDGRPFYAMRFIRGNSLKEALSKFHKQPDQKRRDNLEHDLEFRGLVQRMIDVCNAIEYAHNRGVLHRDLKPDNIMLGKYGETLVVDWGLARAKGQSFDAAPADQPEHQESQLSPTSGSEANPTMTGVALGTPHYMSPEQAAGRLKELGPATDVYSLGATFYALLTGQPPIGAQAGSEREKLNIPEILRRVEQGEFPAPRSVMPNVPAGLNAICLKAMSLRPSDRYGSARRLADDLERWLAGEPVTAFPEPFLIRMQRYARKHPGPISALAATILVGVLGLATGLYFVNSEKNEKVLAFGREAQERQKAVNANKELDSANKSLTATNHALDQARIEADEKRSAAEASEKALAIAKQKTDETAGQLQTALAQSVTQLANHRVSFAQKAYWGGDVAAATALLEQVPSAERRWEWSYNRRQFSGELWRMSGHTKTVVSLACSPDGTMIASGGEDGKVTIWDAHTGQQICIALQIGYVTTALAFTPDNQRLAIASGGEGIVAIWNTKTRKVEKLLPGQPVPLFGIGYSGDGRRLVTCGGGGTDGKTPGLAKLWNPITGECLQTFGGHRGTVWGVAISRDGHRVATASQDSNARIWNADTGQELLQLAHSEKFVSAVAISHDGQLVATGAWDGVTRLWELNSGRAIGDYKISDAVLKVFAVQFSPDDSFLGVAGDPKSAVFVVGRPEKPTSVFPTGKTRSVAFSADGTRLVSGGHDFIVRVHDALNRSNLFANELEGSGLAVLPDGRSAAVGTDDGRLRLIDVLTAQTKVELSAHNSAVRIVAASRDAPRIATTSGRMVYPNKDDTPGEIKIWDSESGLLVQTIQGFPLPMRRMSLSDNGQLLATVDSKHVATLWSVSSGQSLATLQIANRLYEGNSEIAVVFSPDSSQVVVRSYSGELQVHDAKTGDLLRTLPGGGHRTSSNVEDVAFSHDGRWVATGTNDSSIMVWDAESLAPVMTLHGHSSARPGSNIGSIRSLLFSQDGARLFSSSDDGTIKVWDTRTQTEVTSLAVPGAALAMQLNMSRDGSLLGGAYGTRLRLWDARPVTESLNIPVTGSWISTQSFSPTGDLLAVTSNLGGEGVVDIYRAETGEAVRTLRGCELLEPRP